MKIAIAIMSCVKNAERREAVRRTWVKDIPFGIDYFFFVGHVGVSDAISLPCGDAYEDCAFKQIEMIKFVKDYDYVFFCDDDTYVVIDRLMLCGFEAHDYMGCPCMLYEECVAAHGGAGFWMSKPVPVSIVVPVQAFVLLSTAPAPQPICPLRHWLNKPVLPEARLTPTG